MTLSRSGFTVVTDMRIPPEDQIPQFLGHPAGGPLYREQVIPHPWTEGREERASNDLLGSHARNFLDCIKSRKRPVADVQDAHRVAAACHLANLSLRLGRTIRWDADKEEIIGDPEASALLVRAYRKPWDEGLRSVKGTEA